MASSGGGLLTASVDLEPAIDLLVRISGGADNALQSLIQDTADTMTEQLHTTAPVRKDQHDGLTGGQLRDSLIFSVGELGATLLGVDYASYVIMGTVPHPIAARNASALSFFWTKQGSRFIGKSVHHPGTIANDFRLLALENAVNMGEIDLVAARFFQNLVGGAP